MNCRRAVILEKGWMREGAGIASSSTMYHDDNGELVEDQAAARYACIVPYTTTTLEPRCLLVGIKVVQTRQPVQSACLYKRPTHDMPSDAMHHVSPASRPLRWFPFGPWLLPFILRFDVWQMRLALRPVSLFQPF
jgi:hypothetical protein